MRIRPFFIVSTLLMAATAVQPSGTQAQPAPPLPGLAIIQTAPSQLTDPDITLVDTGLPARVRLTVDARIVPDAFEETKIPIGWVGSNALAYASASGQQIVSEPLYLQRIGSPRRVLLAPSVVAAAPFGSRLAVASGAPDGLTLSIMNLARGTTVHMTLPAHTRYQPGGFGSGTMSLAWSPAGDRIAAVWAAPSGIRVAVCNAGSGRCALGLHRGDLGWTSSQSILTLNSGWLDAADLLVATAPQFRAGSAHLVIIPAGTPSTRGAPAVAAGHALSRPQVVALTVSPYAPYAALLVKSPGNGPYAVQAARISSGKLVPGPSTPSGTTLYTGAMPSSDLVFAPPQQEWVGRSFLYATSAMHGHGAVGPPTITGTLWRMDAAGGHRQIAVQGALWGAMRPSIAPLSSYARTQGVCPTAPAASTVMQSHFGFDAPTSIRQTVAYFRALRQQAFAMADGSCLSTIAAGSFLSSTLAQIRSIPTGDVAQVPGDISVQRVTVNLKAGTASETARITSGETVYRRYSVIRRSAGKRTRVTYGLKLRYVGKPHGFPEYRWMVVSGPA